MSRSTFVSSRIKCKLSILVVPVFLALVGCGGGLEQESGDQGIESAEEAEAEIRTSAMLEAIQNGESTLPEREQPQALTSALSGYSRVYYIDGTSGNDSNDGLSETRPLKTFNSKVLTDNSAILLRRGSIVMQVRNIWPRNTFIGAFGPSSLAKPILQIPQGSAYQISVQSQEFYIKDIDLRGGVGLVGSAINGAKATRLVVENCVISGWTNGVRFVGSNGIIRGNTIKDFTGVGIFGGSNDYVAPSYYDISYNTIDSSKGRDGISLHDGFGKGIGNVIRKNSIFGGIENGIDILGMYPSTIIEDNVIRDVGLAGIIVSMGDDNISGAHDSVIRRNSISRSRTAGIYSRADRIMISENVLYKMYESRTSSGLIISGSATVTDNQIIVPSSVDRPAILIIQAPGRPKPTGIIQNNRVTSSNRTAYVFTIESDLVLGWNIDYNVYYVPYSNGIYFDSLTFEAWRAKNWGGIQSLKDRNSAFSAGAAL